MRSIREQHREDLAAWWGAQIAPILRRAKDAGLTEDEVNFGFSRAIFDLTPGLHGFPRSARP